MIIGIGYTARGSGLLWRRFGRLAFAPGYAGLHGIGHDHGQPAEEVEVIGDSAPQQHGRQHHIRREYLAKKQVKAAFTGAAGPRSGEDVYKRQVKR